VGFVSCVSILTLKKNEQFPPNSVAVFESQIHWSAAALTSANFQFSGANNFGHQSITWEVCWMYGEVLLLTNPSLRAGVILIGQLNNIRPPRMPSPAGLQMAVAKAHFSG
jgi:hypothetical protein